MKNSIISAVLALVTLLVMSNLDFFNSVLWFPNFLWILPLYVFYRISVTYFTIVFKFKGSVVKKLLIVGVNVIFIALLLYFGFQLWKVNQGNLFSENLSEFQINLKNIWFWVVYQTHLLLFFFSAFKLLITIDQK